MMSINPFSVLAETISPAAIQFFVLAMIALIIIGTNAGVIAGQSILHCHIHLIPRREGDVDNPQGGVRSVIPKKQHYKRKV